MLSLLNIMESIIQNNPSFFQSSGMKTLSNMNGIFRLENNDGTLSICDKVLKIYDIEYLLIKEPQYIGGSYWLSSIAMLLYIENNKKLFDCKDILELGSGLGLPGMHLARVCGGSVTLSDIEANVTHDSLYINNMIGCVDNCFIDWNNSAQHTGKYDVIIASDCIYRNTQGIFVETIKNLLKNDGTLIMFNAIRDGIDEFEYSLQELFDTNLVMETKKLIFNNHYFIELMFFKARL